MEARSPRELAEACVEALNARDLEAMLELATEDFELVTMHRGTLGRGDIEGWLERQSYGVGMYLVPERWEERDGGVIMAGSGEWRSVDTGAVEGSAEAAITFHVRDGKVARVQIHPSLDAALASPVWASAPRSST
jgi:ketosteroid isomerase-like protein